jgi:outer membrane receptor for ferrienterochelin and colicins
MKTKFYIIIILLLITVRSLNAQNTFKAIIKDSVTKETLIGVAATLENSNTGTSSDDKGLITINNIPDGKQNIIFYLIGYKKTIRSFNFPLPSTNNLTIYLTPDQTDLEEITVTSTRTNSRIDDLPTKIEVLGQEEMDEESTIVPGNISSILGDLSIITIQRTNQVNGNEAIRMQGLDPKYTQIMRDGLPLYGGFSGSLGVLSIPPLDLKQVEIIKGSASTLYGGGAIGGLINFISKRPTDSTQGTVTLNGTSLGEGNVNAFISGKKNKIGATLFAGANIKQAVDINKDGFTEIPSDQNYTIHPRLFFDINPKTELIIGLSSNYDKRMGGDIFAVKNNTDSIHPFLQKENTFRNTLDLTFSKEISKIHTITIKTAGSSFQRDVNYSGFIFNGTQYSSYSEINDVIKLKKHTVVAGLNFISEKFVLGKNDAPQFNNYNYYTAGSFLQDDWQAFKKVSFQLGLRYDHHNTFGQFLLPRISMFYRPNSKFSCRLAVGSGYKTPNPFDLSEPNAKLNAVPKNIKSENSCGVNADINYHTILFDKLSFEINQAFYYTNIQHPIILKSDTSFNLFAGNGNYNVNSYGTDTYIRFKLDEIELYLGYNHTESIQEYSTINYNMPFNPKDKLSGTLAYEIEGKWRMGIEAAYTANQYVYNNKKVNNFLFMAGMIERRFKRGSVVLNCENILDVRQTQFEPIVEGTRQSPVFRPIWGPVEGRVINVSVKINI